MPCRTFLPSSVSQHSNRRLQRCAAVTLSSGRAHKQETDEPMEGHQCATGPMLRSIRCFCRLAESFHTGCAAARDCRGLDHLQLVMAHFHLIISVELGKLGKPHNIWRITDLSVRYLGESLPVPCAQGSTILMVICISNCSYTACARRRCLKELLISISRAIGIPWRSDESSLRSAHHTRCTRQALR